MKVQLWILVIAAMAVSGVQASSSSVLYQQDFETLLVSEGFPPNSVSDDGWLVFGNVYREPTDLIPINSYGPFLAPNGTGGFCAVEQGQGGANQGVQQFSIFSDYNNFTPHIAGQYVESLVFQERTIVADDIGSTVVLSFDAKRGLIDGETTATAFFKTLDPMSSFATTNEVELDTTNLPNTWARYEIALDLSDPMLEGQILQFGFANIATSFEGSSMFYDNVEMIRVVDSDGDGIVDSADNCSATANPDQRDTDGDSIGNACDADLNNDCAVNFEDLGSLKAVFFSDDANADLDGDGAVNFTDLGIMKEGFFAAPGPSGLENICEGTD
ncbi:MAG: hypothetical protein AAGJ70_13850 [Pseudomonadota bacterium]